MNFSRVVSNLFGIFKGYSVEDPIVKIKVKGFEASIEKKDGVLLYYKAENEGEEKKPACAGFHYEIKLRPTGENPDYPAEEKPIKMILTKSLDKAIGYRNGVIFISGEDMITKIVVEEKYSAEKGATVSCLSAAKLPPHHVVYVNVYGMRNGRETEITGCGYMIRKSETETPDWKRATGTRSRRPTRCF